MRVTAVIPAYNEERTVAEVVRAVIASPLVADVVVVNDGSRDGTSLAASRAGARVIDLPENRGKGAAIQAAVAASEGEALLLLDADLVGLEPDHVQRLLSPVLAGEADMTIGVFERGRTFTDLAQAITPGLSGQRAVLRSLLQGVAGLDLVRFGTEVSLNRTAERSRARVVTVQLPRLTHVMKEEKMGFARGFLARLRMYADILAVAWRRRG
ncbi:MAG TPA: glycosyltransferase [Bacillota bacterium]|nr:glycosyltransferase [Bacillota bacterium]